MCSVTLFLQLFVVFFTFFFFNDTATTEIYTLSLHDALPISFVGIGTGAPDSILMSQGEILPVDTLNEIKTSGAVGDISLRFFSSSGNLINHPINERIIGISDLEIRNIPRVIAIAGGQGKYEAIKGALKSGLLNVLITDYETGMKLSSEEI